MSDRAPSAPPRQAGLASMLIVLGAGLLVVLAFRRMPALGSVEFQTFARSALDRPALRDTGLGVDDVQRIFRIMYFVVAASGIASVILAVEVRRRSRSARVPLSVLAPIVLISGFSISPVPAVAVAAGVAMLWTQPTRDWLARRSAPPGPVATDPRPYGRPPAPPASPIAQPAPPASPVVQPTPAAQPAPDGPSAWAPPAPPQPAPYLPPYPTVPDPARPDRGTQRPGPVVAACVVTWVACGLVGVVTLLAALVVSVASDDLLDQARPKLQDSGISDHRFVVAAVVSGLVLALWSLAAAAVAVAAFRGRSWAAVTLIASAAVAALLCVVALLSSIVSVIPLAACGACVVLLLRPESRAWYAARRARGSRP